jgi:hypothetical protein
MNNVGDVKTFILNGQTPSEPITYVWNWWDSTVNVTASGTVSKALNIGGNPSDSYLVRYSVTDVDDIGQSSTFSDSMVVNNPPSIVTGTARLSHNGETFSFQTSGTLVAYDLESHVIQFAWFAGGQFVGNGSNSSQFGHVTGTYAGTQIGERMVSSSQIDLVVTTNGSLTCFVWDDQGGTTAVEFPLFGHSPQAIPLSTNSSSGGTTVDASGTPTLRIGANEFAQFVVYTPSQTHQLTFQWAYFGSNGWAQTEYSNGTTTAFSDGSFQNVDLKAVQNETVGQKVAECFVRDTTTGFVSTVKLGINLVANQLPVINAVNILPVAPHVGDVLSFSADASDPNGDLVHYTWNFTSPSVVTLYGRKVYKATTGLGVGVRVSGQLVVTDNLGAQKVANFQSAALAA